MSSSFDPNIPGTSPSDPSIEGTISVQVVERPTLGKANLVIDGDNPFDIDVSWSVTGTLVPLWLTALAVKTKFWVVTAYANPRGPGTGINLGSVTVPIGTAPFPQTKSYSAKLTVPAKTLPEEDPGNPNNSGVYQLTVTAFLDSDLGPIGYDMMGFADGPVVKVESPQ